MVGETKGLDFQPSQAHILVVEALKTLPVSANMRVHGNVEFCAYGIPRPTFYDGFPHGDEAKRYWQDALAASGIKPWQINAFCYDESGNLFKPDREHLDSVTNELLSDQSPYGIYVHPTANLNETLGKGEKPHFVIIDMDDRPSRPRWGYELFRSESVDALLEQHYLPLKGYLWLESKSGYGEGYHGYYLDGPKIQFSLQNGHLIEKLLEVEHENYLNKNNVYGDWLNSLYQDHYPASEAPRTHHFLSPHRG